MRAPHCRGKALLSERCAYACAASLTGKADLYGPSYSSGHLAQRPPLYDRSIYMPSKPYAQPEQATLAGPWAKQVVDLGLRRGYHTAEASAV